MIPKCIIEHPRCCFNRLLSFGNFFAITNLDELWTPAQGVLKGVTRAAVLEKIAQQSKLFKAVHEMPKITENHVPGFVEAFRTSTTTGIVPIARLNNYQFNLSEDSKTQQLRKSFLEYVESYYRDHRA